MGDMSNIRPTMPIVAAVVALNSCEYDVILLDEVVTELMSLSTVSIPFVSVNDVVDERSDTANHVAESVSDGIVGEVQGCDAVVNVDDCGNDGELTDDYVSEMNKLISKQKNMNR